MDPDQLLQIGKITGAFGVTGEVKIFRMAEDLMHFHPGRQVMLLEKGGGYTHYTVVTAKPHKNILRVRFEEIEDRNAAEEVVGARLFIPRSALPETDSDTWYWCDLIGLDVYSVDELYVGRVTAMIDTGSNDVFVVSNDDGETLVPFIESVVIEINPENGRVVVDLPEGL